MKEVKLTEQQILEEQKAELVNDLIAVSTIKEELWQYHPDNPMKKDIVKEYDILNQIEKETEEELAKLK